MIETYFKKIRSEFKVLENENQYLKKETAQSESKLRSHKYEHQVVCIFCNTLIAHASQNNDWGVAVCRRDVNALLDLKRRTEAEERLKLNDPKI